MSDSLGAPKHGPSHHHLISSSPTPTLHHSSGPCAGPVGLHVGTAFSAHTPPARGEMREPWELGAAGAASLRRMRGGRGPETLSWVGVVVFSDCLSSVQLET